MPAGAPSLKVFHAVGGASRRTMHARIQRRLSKLQNKLVRALEAALAVLMESGEPDSPKIKWPSANNSWKGQRNC